MTSHLTLSRYIKLLQTEPPKVKPLTIEDRVSRPITRRRSLNEAAHKLPHHR